MTEEIKNEVMSDDELEQVSGGSASELADDSRFLNSLNGSTDRWNATKIFFDDEKAFQIFRAWDSLGVQCVFSNNIAVDNEYYIDGNPVTQEQARQYAMKVTGHYMNESDWKW